MRLQTDHIDLYQMHHIDRETPWQEVWQAMEQLVQQGKVIYVGSSNFAGWHIAQAQETATKRNFLGLISEQSLYNLAARTVELEVIPACQKYGLGLIPWSPLSGGMLAGSSGGEAGSRRTSERVQDRAEEHASQLMAYEAFCEDMEETPADVAIAWLLHQPGVTAPIIGPRTLAQLRSSLHAAEIELDQDMLNRLDQIWPGPGGPAPEAYAW
jgi:aryl-alcohol dehydrogenase-like predicted oxidoreductase